MQVLTVHAPGDLRLMPLAPPAPGVDDVVVRVRACGICGSDLGFARHGNPRPGGGPMPIGHEFAGEIVRVGSAVRDLAVGQRVVVDPMATPGPLGNGGSEGAFGEEVLVRSARLGGNVHRLPDDASFELGALVEPLAVSLHGVNRAAARAGERVVVLGCGMIGLGVVLWLAERGVTDIVAVDLSDERLARACEMGATATINPAREPLAARLAALHGAGRVFSRAMAMSDLFVDAAGSAALLGECVALARRHARIVVLAAYHGAVPVNFAHVLSAELTVTAALAYPTEMPEVIAALPRIRARAERLITHRFTLPDALEAFRVAATPAAAKVLIEMGAP